jgi:hypothetical protein
MQILRVTAVNVMSHGEASLSSVVAIVMNQCSRNVITIAVSMVIFLTKGIANNVTVNIKDRLQISLYLNWTISSTLG